MVSDQQIRHSSAVASELSALGKLCRHILSEAQRQNYSEDDIFAVHLALEEAFINAVKHGSKNDPTRKIKVDYSITAEKIELRVTDQGTGFDPQAVPDPRCQGNLCKTSGRGLLLMRSFMNDVEFNKTGNRVRMVRYKDQPALPVVESKGK